jgi:uncharacterized protein (TIGR00251 family)
MKEGRARAGAEPSRQTGPTKSSAVKCTLLIDVHIVPNSKQPLVRRLGDSTYEVRVDAVPRDGKANRRLVEILSDHFRVPKSGIFIVKGAKSRDKTVEIGLRGP